MKKAQSYLNVRTFLGTVESLEAHFVPGLEKRVLQVLNGLFSGPCKLRASPHPVGRNNKDALLKNKRLRNFHPCLLLQALIKEHAEAP